MKNVNLTEKEISRFLEKIAKPMEDTQCWEWTANKDKDGYGMFFLRRKNRRAHRVSYYAYKGEIPDGYVIHHICKNPSCVNPNHLEARDKHSNWLDSNNVGAINKRKKYCKNGHPFDKVYGGQRYCSICENEKQKRLRKKWKKEPLLEGV
jgi:hypothetical protein